MYILSLSCFTDEETKAQQSYKTCPQITQLLGIQISSDSVLIFLTTTFHFICEETGTFTDTRCPNRGPSPGLEQELHSCQRKL